MAKFFKKSKNRKVKIKPANKENSASFWRGAIIGALFSIIGSLITSIIQNYYSKQQQSTQLYLEEKKEFVSACNDYLTQFKVWHDLMQYSSAKDSVSTEYSPYTKKSVRAAYFKWYDDFNAAYSKLYLISDNEFGAKTLYMSSGLSKALKAFVFTDTLSVNQRFAQAQDLDLFFIKYWLNEAKHQIFQYNTGIRRQRTEEDYLREINKKIRINVESDPSRVWYGDSTVLRGTELNEAIFPDSTDSQ